MLFHSRVACLVVGLAACGSSSSPDASPDADVSIDGPAPDGAVPSGGDTSFDLALTTPVDTPVDVAIATVAPRATTFSVASAPGHGELTGTGPTWTYRPTAGYVGTDTLSVRGDSGHGRTTVFVAITIADPDAPVANPDAFEIDTSSPLTIAQASLLANDRHAAGRTLTVTGVTAPSDGHGTPTIEGSNVVFRPAIGFLGSAGFVYVISDGVSTAQAAVHVQVGARDPIAEGDAVHTLENTPVTLAVSTLLANDHDSSGVPLELDSVFPGASTHLAIALSADRTQVTITPAQGFIGFEQVAYRLAGGASLSAVGFITVFVDPR